MRLLSPQTLNAHSITRHRKSQSFVCCFGFSREWNPGQDRYLKVGSGTSQMYVYAGQFREIFLALLEHSDAHALWNRVVMVNTPWVPAILSA